MSLLDAIGAYGLAIIVLTLIIRIILSPLFQFQLVRQRRSMVEQRKLAPQIQELRKKYKKEPQKLNQETMKLYQEHGVNPLGGMVGCLPMVIQMPVLIALYYVFTGFAKTSHVAAHFFFIPNLNDNPNHHLLFTGLPIPTLAYLVFPLLAALTTLVQTRMMQMPPSATPTDQEQQTQQMQRTMVWISPLMIGWFALNVPAGLGLYWFVGNCVSIIQQSFVVGWGNVVPAWLRGGSGSQPPPQQSKGTTGSQKAGPGNPPKTGPKPKKPRN
ncbi:MAG TPA: YidC/Oxa1 family membrane protein insertase [Patescibacteria group bacterium]|nr:YidC/Oxa1 family membrane protein insertase [Patescibacteria group bacterium]